MKYAVIRARSNRRIRKLRERLANSPTPETLAAAKNAMAHAENTTRALAARLRIAFETGIIKNQPDLIELTQLAENAAQLLTLARFKLANQYQNPPKSPQNAPESTITT